MARDRPSVLEVSIVGADQRGELRPGGMAHDQEAIRIAPVLGDVVVHPMDRLGDVAHDGRHVDARQEPVVRRDEDESLLHEDLRLPLDVGLVADLPAAAVNPEDDRPVLRTRRRIDVEHLPLVVAVGDVALDVLGLSLGQEGQEE